MPALVVTAPTTPPPAIVPPVIVMGLFAMLPFTTSVPAARVVGPFSVSFWFNCRMPGPTLVSPKFEAAMRNPFRMSVSVAAPIAASESRKTVPFSVLVPAKLSRAPSELGPFPIRWIASKVAAESVSICNCAFAWTKVSPAPFPRAFGCPVMRSTPALAVMVPK